MFLPSGHCTFLQRGDEILLQWELDSEPTLLFFRKGIGLLYVAQSDGKVMDNWPIALPVTAFRQVCMAIAVTHGVSVSSEEFEGGSLEGRNWLRANLI